MRHGRFLSLQIYGFLIPLNSPEYCYDTGTKITKSAIAIEAQTLKLLISTTSLFFLPITPQQHSMNYIGTKTCFCDVLTNLSLNV